jgi:hypothetical protein
MEHQNRHLSQAKPERASRLRSNGPAYDPSLRIGANRARRFQFLLCRQNSRDPCVVRPVMFVTATDMRSEIGVQLFQRVRHEIQIT